MSEIRKNPPASVVGEEELTEYETLYDDITQNGTILRFDDRHALAELAISLVEMRLCRADIRKNGSMMEVQGDRNVVMKPNPSIATLQKLQVHVKAMFKAFSMTPESRGKTSQGIESGNTDDGFSGV